MPITDSQPTLPLILESKAGTSPVLEHPKMKLFHRLMIFSLIGVIAIELVFAGSALLKPAPTAVVSRPTPIEGGQISLISERSSYQIGETIPVSIRLSTGGQTVDGADLIIKYDPALLDASSPGIIQTGSIYRDYPVLEVDNKKGLIRISAVNKEGGFNGLGIFADVMMTAKAVGMTQLSVQFEPGFTNDSNLIKSGSTYDILERTQDLKVTIQ